MIKVVKKESQTRAKDDDFYQRIPTQLHTETGGEQSKEIKRLEKQIQNYLKKLKDLIHKVNKRLFLPYPFYSHISKLAKFYQHNFYVL